MNRHRERIQDDLRGIVSGTVDSDDTTTQLYSTDGSIHQMVPLSVVCPRHTDDVIQCVEYAGNRGWGIHPRGAGSSLSGESLGEGIVLDFSRFMRRVIEIDGDVVSVQPGAVRERLNQGVSAYGLVFGPDGGNLHASTIGGQVAINSAGPSWLKYGAPGDHLVSIKAILANGAPVVFDRDSGVNPVPGSPIHGLVERLNYVYRKYSDVIDAPTPNRYLHHGGYDLTALRNGNIDFLRLLAGSEGTLAIFTELTLKLQPLPAYRSAQVFFFDSVRKAADAGIEVLRHNVDSCDLMDRRHLHMIAEFDVRLELIIPKEAEAALLVMCSADSLMRLRDRTRRISEQLCIYKSLAFGEASAWDENELRLFMLLRRSDQPLTDKFSVVRPTLFIEDVTVSPLVLGDFIGQLQKLMQSFGVMSSMLVHVPQGQVYLQPLLNLRLQPQRATLEQFALEYYKLVWSYQGFLGRQHGTGLSRLHYLPLQNPPYHEVYRAIKKAFDPTWTIQPGKIITSQLPQSFPHIRKDLIVPLSDIRTEPAENSDSLSIMLGVAEKPHSENPVQDKQSTSKKYTDKQHSDNQGAGNQYSDEKGSGNQSSGNQGSDNQYSDEQGSGNQGSGNQYSDEQGSSAASDSFGGRFSKDDPSTTIPLRDLTALQLNWQQEKVAIGSLICTGCGTCRCEPVPEESLARQLPCDSPVFDTYSLRMCPLFRVDPKESYSPRAKSNLIRSFVLGKLPLEELLTPKVKSILDSCVNCRSCQYECTAHAPIPQLILQAKGAYYSAKGMSVSDWLFGRLDKVCAFLLRFQPLSDVLIRTSWFRCALEHLIGLSAGRRIPPLARRPFQHSYSMRPLVEQSQTVLNADPLSVADPAASKTTVAVHKIEPPAGSPQLQDTAQQLTAPKTSEPKILFFVDMASNYLRTLVPEAVARVFEHNGIQLEISRDQLPSGLTALTAGMAETALNTARYNFDLMTEAVRAGYDIIVAEPADTFCLKYEYPLLLEDDFEDRIEDTRVVFDHIFDVHQWLLAYHQNGRLALDFAPLEMTVGYHAPCRLRALNIGFPGANLLRLIPKLNVELLNSGCCGMAGTFGLQKKNYYNSLRIGMPLITRLRDPMINISASECTACRMAMEHRSTKPCFHPSCLMAYSYGLLPELGPMMKNR